MLFNELIFGPIRSRRLGISLGVNLLPTDGKWCSFDCVYCECGYNSQGKGSNKLPSKIEVATALEEKLVALKNEGTIPNVITFAGNGEPTLHPQFDEIIDDTIALRDRYFPEAKISVLSNGTMVSRPKVFEALLKIDNNILKLDSVLSASARTIYGLTTHPYDVESIVSDYARFEGHIIVQTMFLRGEHDGKIIDNTTNEEVDAWLEAIAHINPEQVMIYSLDRQTPEEKLSKVSAEEMEEIAKKVRKLGIDISVAS